jgi:hypothetical protein
MRKKLAAAALSASLLVGGAAGAALFVPGVATAASSASGAVAPQWMTDALDKLVSDGTIDQSQADAVSQALEAAKPADRGGDHHGGGGMGLSAAATALGISEADLRTALEGGKTIAQVAADKGVDVQTVIDAMVAAANAHIDSEVASGEITQAQADARKADVVARVTEAVNNTRPAGRPDGAGPGGRGHGGPPPAADDGSGSTTTTTA